PPELTSLWRGFPSRTPTQQRFGTFAFTRALRPQGETHKSKEVNDETHSDRCRERGHFGSRSLDDGGECPTNVSGPRSVSSLCPSTDGPDTTLCPTPGPSLCSSRACPDRCQCSRRCCSRWGQLPL